MKELLVPILLSAAVCFAISILAWGMMPFHSREHRRLSTEPHLLDALRRDMPAPGIYSFPFRGPRGALSSRADVAANLERGPVGYVVIGKPGAPEIVTPMVMHFVFFVIVASLAAFVATSAGLKDGAPFGKVFRVVATVSSMALVLGAVPESIWFNRPWKSWILQCADGLVCGLAMGGVFGWFWPQ
jgi:hypothetical protein